MRFGRRVLPNCPTACAMNPRVCVFCGGNVGSDESYVRVACDVARAIVGCGYGIVYGGGRIGLMGALADAALEASGEVIGIVPRALATVEVAHDGLSRLEVVETMHERKARMVALSSAFIALPGGFGTMDEFCEVLSWRQLALHDRPIGILNHRGYFDDLLGLFDGMLARGFVSPANRRLVIAADSIEELLGAMSITPV